MKNLVIDRDAIRNNLNIVKSRARGVDIIADLSADAFGMGIVETARIMREEGVTSFAVSDPRDAERLRNLGFTDERLMMLRSTADSDEIRDLIELGVGGEAHRLRGADKDRFRPRALRVFAHGDR